MVYVIVTSPDEVSDGHHTHEPALGGAPQRAGAHPLLHHGVQSLDQRHPRVQQHQLRVGVDQVVALVVLEEVLDVIVVNLPGVEPVDLGRAGRAVPVEDGRVEGVEIQLVGVGVAWVQTLCQ